VNRNINQLALHRIIIQGPIRRLSQAVLGGSVGGLIACYLWLLAGGLAGAGHGSYSAITIGGAPFGFFWWCWPLIGALSAEHRRYAAGINLTLLMTNIVGAAIYTEGFRYVGLTLDRLSGEMRASFWLWMVVYTLAVASVLAQSFWLVCLKRGVTPRRPESPE
jgi:hypothetical protein